MAKKPIIPKTLDEAIQFLMKDNEGNSNISNDEGRFLSEQHHFVGRNLRNEWGLWTGSNLQTWFKERGIHHADDMSSIILTSFHRNVNGKDIELDEQIKHYRNFWEKTNPKVNEGTL